MKLIEKDQRVILRSSAELLLKNDEYDREFILIVLQRIAIALDMKVDDFDAYALEIEKENDDSYPIDFSDLDTEFISL